MKRFIIVGEKLVKQSVKLKGSKFELCYDFNNSEILKNCKMSRYAKKAQENYSESPSEANAFLYAITNASELVGSYKVMEKENRTVSVEFKKDSNLNWLLFKFEHNAAEKKRVVEIAVPDLFMPDDKRTIVFAYNIMKLLFAEKRKTDAENHYMIKDGLLTDVSGKNIYDFLIDKQYYDDPFIKYAARCKKDYYANENMIDAIKAAQILIGHIRLQLNENPNQEEKYNFSRYKGASNKNYYRARILQKESEKIIRFDFGLKNKPIAYIDVKCNEEGYEEVEDVARAICMMEGFIENYENDVAEIKNYKELEFWSNACGDLFENGRDISEEELPKELQTAYQKLLNENSGSYEYLVKYHGRYWVALCNEFHEQLAEDIGVTMDEMYDLMKSNLQNIHKHPAFKDTVLLFGKETGFEACHEAFVLVPTNFANKINQYREIERILYDNCYDIAKD